MENNRKEEYFNFGFGIVLFMLLSYYFGNLVFHAKSALQSGIIAIICAPVSFGVAYWMKGKKAIVKTVIAIIIICLMLAGYFVKKYIKAHQRPPPLEKMIEGKWTIRENMASINVDINDTIAKIAFMPLKREFSYAYKIQGKRVDFYYHSKSAANSQSVEKLIPDMNWDIMKISPDSLVVNWDEELVRFGRGN